jgi:hypothetical protein
MLRICLNRARQWWFSFLEQKDIYLLKFIGGCVISIVLHVYQREGWQIGYESFKQAGSKQWTCQAWDGITLSPMWRTLHESGMPCARTAIRPCIPCQWNWILLSALYMQLYGILYMTVCSQWVQSLVTGHTRNSACQYCWKVYRCTILRTMHLYSRWWQAMRPGVTILNPHKNQQVYSGDISLHLSERNSSYKHLLVKWYWPCSLALRDRCFLTVMTQCRLLLSKSSKAEYDNGTNVWVNSLKASSCCTTVPSPYDQQNSGPAEYREIEGSQTSHIQSRHMTMQFSDVGVL